MSEWLDRTSVVEGAVLEVGCFRGQTTMFLAKHLDDIGSAKTYYAIDTFGGFTSDDVAHEVAARGKPSLLSRHFSSNDKRWLDRALSEASITRVRTIQADAGRFDYKSLGPISFALLDVDLYLPSKAALAQIYEQLGVGGVIIVDDCKQGIYDGALQAYEEFVSSAPGKPKAEINGKLGVIEKPSNR